MAAPYEQLRVWQLAHELAIQVYKATATYPSDERYGLVSQLRRAAVAVPTNIVEGNARSHRREYLQYCYIARASNAEVKYLLRLSGDLGVLDPENCRSLVESGNQLGRMLQALINNLAGRGR